MCEYCEDKKKFGDFDGKTYAEVRTEKYFGWPAALMLFCGPSYIAGYGINCCPMCGRRLGVDA